MKSLLSLFYSLTLSLTFAQTEIKCPLTWHHFSTGDLLPPSTIPTFKDEQFIARVHQPGGYKIGTLEALTGIAHIGPNSYSSFEILTNPLDCRINWVPAKGPFGYITPLYAWPVDSSKSSPTTTVEYVGRGQRNGIWFGGNVRPDRGQLDFGDILRTFPSSSDSPENLNRTLKTTEDYQVLQSYSSGLTLDIVDVDVDMDLDALRETTEFLGMDEIQNDGEVDINFVLTHRKRIKKVVSVTTNLTTVLSLGVNATINVSQLPFGTSIKIFLEFAFNLTIQTYRTVEDTSDTEVTVTREISVPAQKSIVACSILNIVDNARSAYTATGVIRGRGLTGNEVNDVLVQAGVRDGEVDGDSVLVPVSGTLALNNWQTSTKFIVYPVDSMRNKCNDLKRQSFIERSEAAKEEKRQKELQRIKDKEMGLDLTKLPSDGGNYEDSKSKYLGVPVTMADYEAVRAASLEKLRKK